MSTVTIRTRDGSCPAYLSRPDGKGPWPPVLVFMDGIGIRPAMLAIGERLATYGYFVLLPDLFYRSGPYEPMNAKTVFSDPEQRKMLMEKFMSRATLPNLMADTAAFLDFFTDERDAEPGRVATTGYCMGGAASVSAAGTYPDRITAAAAYHPGRLATDAPESPHRLAPRITARLYIARASDDASFPDDMKDRFERALREAGVRYELETYPARHGFVLRDTPAFDQVAQDRHWQTLTGLLENVF